MIIDANLGIKDNLQNIFFLEFNLADEVKNNEKLKILREIKNENVEKELFFTLNVKNYLIKRALFMEFQFSKLKLNFRLKFVNL
jgi:hypothetical protein